jgi:predicted dinucleotide-binding enzyme
MQLAVLGTGMVGETIASALSARGHAVMMGSRARDNPKALAWAAGRARASTGTFADAARHGEILFNCTLGSATLEALRLAGEAALADKILVDVANPLDFSKGMPPTLTICNTDSLGEQVQRAFPRLKVVKGLNTMRCDLMVRPSLVPGDHDVLLCGNDSGAKTRVATLLHEDLGWKRQNIRDLGDITAARGTEMLLPVWLRVWGMLKHPNFNFRIVVGDAPTA